MKRIISFILVAILMFMLVGCKQNGQMDDMEQRIAQLEQALKNQADVNDELSTELEEQKTANEWLGELILTQQGLLDEQQETIDSQQTQIGRAEEAIDNLLGKPIEFTESAPVYGPRESDVILKEFFAYNQPYDEEKGEYVEGYALEEIKSYYNTEFRDLFDEEFYLLEPKDYVYCPGYHGAFFQASVYAEENEGKLVNPIIREDFYVLDLALRYYDYHTDRVEQYEGGWAYSVHLDVFFVPFPIDYMYDINITRHLRLYFGKQTVGEEEITYFNIWFGGNAPICIGTCYYTPGTPLTARWFEKYFMQNLFKLGDEE